MRRALIVGADPLARLLAEQLERQGRCRVVGFVEDAPAVCEELRERVLGPRARLLHFVGECQVDEVFVAHSPQWLQWLMAELAREPRRVEVSVVPGLYECLLARPTFRRAGDIALLSLTPREPGRLFRAGKRLFDLGFSLTALTLFAPLLAVAALLIRRGAPGPALFRQERVGQDGRVFKICKLRTMVPDAEAAGPCLCAGLRDPRLTPVGRLLRATRLDEIPQFLNVLRGEMSVVGPRPERPCFVREFEREVPGYAERHRVRPGITGLAQVNGYYASSPREKLRYDLMYIANRSCWLEARILLATFRAMLHR